MPIRELQTIVKAYLKGSFIFEVIPILPFQFLPLNGNERRFYLIKIMRIGIGIGYFDPSAIMEKVTFLNLKRIKNMIERQPELAQSRSEDRTFLNRLMIFKYAS